MNEWLFAGVLEEVKEFYLNNRLPQASIPTVTASSTDEFITQFQVREEWIGGEVDLPNGIHPLLTVNNLRDFP